MECLTVLPKVSNSESPLLTRPDFVLCSAVVTSYDRRSTFIVPPSLAALRAASVSTLDALVTLQSQTYAFRRYARQLDAAHAAENEGLIAESVKGIWGVFRELTFAHARLRAHVTSHDGAHSAESFGELAIRAEMFVVSVELGELTKAVHQERSRETTALTSAGALFVLQSIDIDEMATLFRAGFERANGLWMPHRKTSQRGESGHGNRRGSDERAERHQVAIRQAQRAINALARDTRIAPLLRAGKISHDWPAVHLATTRISAALGIDLIGELDLSLASEFTMQSPLLLFADALWGRR